MVHRARLRRFCQALTSRLNVDRFGYAPIQALAGEDTDFDFSHVQPAGVLGGVVKLDTPEQAPCGGYVRALLRSSCGSGC
jgi:hypothetical protein